MAKRPDPPMEPLAGTKMWLPSDPSVIENSRDDAVLVVRLGLAVNALVAQQTAVERASRSSEPDADKMRDTLLSLLFAAALIKEAVNILTGVSGVAGQFGRVKELASKGAADAIIVSTVGKICGGSHPATPILTLIRNQLVFHWDPDVIRDSLEEFTRNETVIWAEAADKSRRSSFYRLSAEVLANALLPPQTGMADEGDTRKGTTGQERVASVMEPITDALDSVIKFFEAAISGFLLQAGVQIHER